MKRVLNVTTFFYISFALLVAHTSVATVKTLDTRRFSEGVQSLQVERSVQDSPRLDGRLAGDGIGPYDPENLPEPIPEPEPKGKAAYKVVVWTASWCGPCQRYKAKEVPALLKAGYVVEVKDYDTDKPPKEVTKVPTVMLYYKGTLLQTKTYWKAKDIEKYVDNRMSLKG